MRLWSIHPKYLDRVGLVALWREALLAKAVIEGKTKGYKKHPQLERFRKSRNPVNSINSYLLSIYEEGAKRGYKFDKSKIGKKFSDEKIPVKKGQVEYEFYHLKNKLRFRSPEKFHSLLEIKNVETNRIFYVVDGGVESWEKVKT